MAPGRDELRDLGHQLSRQAMRQVHKQVRDAMVQVRGAVDSGRFGLPDGVAEEVRRRFDSWRDPRAKLLRRRRRAVRTTSTFGGLTVVSGTGAGVLEAAVANPGVSVPAPAG